MKKFKFRKIVNALLLFFAASAVSAEPVTLGGQDLSAESWRFETAPGVLRVILNVPDGLYAYTGATGPEFSPALPPSSAPEPVLHKDPVSGGNVPVFAGPGRFVWNFTRTPASFPAKLSVRWQACSETGECFLPGEAALAVFHSEKDWKSGSFTRPALRPVPVPGKTADFPDEAVQDGILLVPEHRVLRTASGYLPPAEFSAFLRGEDLAAFTLKDKGFWATLLIVLLGGLALNLTPCVLPLVPVNLVLIGAGGSSERSRFSRILRGVVYGAGIAVSYGLLGVLAVLSGSTFGTFAGSWIFNGAAALVFLALGLAMFDVFHLDFSRLGSRLRLPESLHYTGIFLMGALSATLAGACVAPVLAAVLVQAAGLFASGNPGGLFLPFLLGIGMALPWPFAAAGLALFPKPGAWMVHVKHALGILIFLLAAYYAYLAVSLFPASRDGGENSASVKGGGPMEQIAAALEEAKKTDKAVLLDFSASWCKNCTAMALNTFPDPEVRAELKHFVTRKISAEKESDPGTGIMKSFGGRGLPFFVILTPEK